MCVRVGRIPLKIQICFVYKGLFGCHLTFGSDGAEYSLKQYFPNILPNYSELSESQLVRLFFATQKPLPQSLTNETDFSKVIPTIETFFREEDPPRRLTKMKW